MTMSNALELMASSLCDPARQQPSQSELVTRPQQMMQFESLPIGPSPQRLPRAFRPGPVIILAADTVFAHVSENLARRRQSSGVDPPVGIPQVGPDDGPGALKINLAHGGDDDPARRFPVHPHCPPQATTHPSPSPAPHPARAA